MLRPTGHARMVTGCAAPLYVSLHQATCVSTRFGRLALVISECNGVIVKPDQLHNPVARRAKGYTSILV